MTEWQYAERILYVDLAARLAWAEPTPLDLKRNYVGGAGFVARLLAGAPAGAVAMAAGPLSDGVAGRLALGARPAGGGKVLLSSLGGRLAAAIKQCGYDALVLSGRLPGPGCLTITPEDVTFADTASLMGAPLPQAEAALARRLGPGFASLLLGPAAEQGDPRAVLAHEGHVAGGSGVAAALGALGLKAVAMAEREHTPHRCTGCTKHCPGVPSASEADALGVDLRAAGAKARRKQGPTVADLLGTCQRVWRERPGQVLTDALGATHSLLA
jgi:aldehyde:ferredoxin oxidoreductase